MTTFNDQLRWVAKEAIKLGMAAGDRLQEVTAEAYERGQDLVAEVRAERAEKQPPQPPTPAKRSPGKPESGSE
jgi:hypothetical protein